jgi:hypothetical protein
VHVKRRDLEHSQHCALATPPLGSGSPLSTAATNCARWRLESVPVWLREKGREALVICVAACFVPAVSWSSAYVVCMRFIALQKLVILLTGLVFLVGTEAQAMPSARLMALSHARAEHTVMGEGCAAMMMLPHSRPQNKHRASAFRSIVPRS